MAKQDEWKRITLRIPPDLHERLTAAAESASLNAMIIEALEEKYPKPQINLNEYTGRLSEEFFNIEDTAERRAYVKDLDKALRADPISDGNTVLDGAKIVAGNLILNVRLMAPGQGRTIGIVRKK